MPQMVQLKKPMRSLLAAQTAQLKKANAWKPIRTTTRGCLAGAFFSQKWHVPGFCWHDFVISKISGQEKDAQRDLEKIHPSFAP